MFKFFKKKGIKDELTLAFEAEFNEIKQIFRQKDYHYQFDREAINTYLGNNSSDKYAIIAMVVKYNQQYAGATKEEKEKIIQNMQTLKNYIKQYSYGIFSLYYNKGSNQKYDETKSILLEKASKLFEKEIADHKAQMAASAKEQEENQKKIEEDIRNL